MAIDALEAGDARKGVRETEDALRPAQKQDAVGHDAASNCRQNARLGRLIEIDKDVAAQHDIELAQDRKVFQQIQGAKRDALAQLRLDLPIGVLLVEVPDPVPTALRQYGPKRGRFGQICAIDAMLTAESSRSSTISHCLILKRDSLGV